MVTIFQVGTLQETQSLLRQAFGLPLGPSARYLGTRSKQAECMI